MNDNIDPKIRKKPLQKKIIIIGLILIILVSISSYLLYDYYKIESLDNLQDESQDILQEEDQKTNEIELENNLDKQIIDPKKIINVSTKDGITLYFFDGTTKTISNIDNAKYVDIDNNKLYYFTYNSGQFIGSNPKIVIMDLDGTVESTINVDISTYLIYVYNNELYFIEGNDNLWVHSIKKMNLETKEITEIVNNISLSSGDAQNWYLDKINKKLIYIKNDVLFTSDLDGKNEVKISNIDLDNHRGININYNNIVFSYKKEIYVYNLVKKSTEIIYSGTGTCSSNNNYYMCGILESNFLNIIKIENGIVTNIGMIESSDISPIIQISEDKFTTGILKDHLYEQFIIIDGNKNVIVSTTDSSFNNIFQ